MIPNPTKGTSPSLYAPTRTLGLGVGFSASQLVKLEKIKFFDPLGGGRVFLGEKKLGTNAGPKGSTREGPLGPNP